MDSYSNIPIENLCLFRGNEDGTYTCVNCGGGKGQYERCPSSTDDEDEDETKGTSVRQEANKNTNEMPSFFQMAKNAGASMVNHAMNSFQSVPANVKEARINICEGCEHYDSETTRCDECGCFINIKADWASEKCPIDKWDMWTDGPSGGCGGCGKK